MRSFLTSWLIMTIAAAVMVAVTPGMTPVGEPPILGIAAFALFMALINASIKPIVHLIALPFAILSLGLVTLIINWLFMRLRQLAGGQSVRRGRLRTRFLVVGTGVLGPDHCCGNRRVHLGSVTVLAGQYE